MKVSTSAPRYRVMAFRLGRYAHGTGRLVWTSGWLSGCRQRRHTFGIVDTRTVVALWRPSVTAETTTWPAGFYVIKLISSDRWEAQVPYVVRSRSVRHKVVLVAPVATWQAYNDWGGYSLYSGPFGDRRSWAVSFERPYPAPGAAGMRFGAVPIVLLAERLGLPLGYLTDLDLDAHPGMLRGAAAYVSLGHDEYWSRRMRSAVTGARDTGTNLAFLGANTMYWRVRVAHAPDVPGPLLVGYRLDAGSDPDLRRRPRAATGLTREDPYAPPENALTGMEYECFPVDTAYRVTTPHWWGFAGTGVRHGTAFAHLVGVEADRVYPVPGTPRPLQVLSSSTYDCRGSRTSAQSVYYTTQSGAGVFNAGTLRWSCALAGACHPYRLDARTVAFARRVTVNVLRTFARGPAGTSRPAHDNVARFRFPAVNGVPAS